MQLAALSAAVGILFTGVVSAQVDGDYPTKSVRVVVASAPGGGSDVQARIIAQKLGESFKPPFIIENRAGGGSTIGYAYVAKSAPDGYVLLAAAPTLTYSPALMSNVPYDPVKDFAPVSLAARSPFLLLVNPATPAYTVKTLVALARSKPGALDAGVGSSGSFTHLAAAYFASAAGIKLNIVPYKDIGQVTVDGIAGQIQMLFGNVVANLSQVKAGKLRALAITSAARATALPEMPTIGESGVPGYDVNTWLGWLAPAGTTGSIINRLSIEITRAVRAPEIARKLVENGGEGVGGPPEEFRQIIASEIPRWKKIVKESGMRIE